MRFSPQIRERVLDRLNRYAAKDGDTFVPLSEGERVVRGRTEDGVRPDEEVKLLHGYDCE